MAEVTHTDKGNGVQHKWLFPWRDVWRNINKNLGCNCYSVNKKDLSATRKSRLIWRVNVVRCKEFLIFLPHIPGYRVYRVQHISKKKALKSVLYSMFVLYVSWGHWQQVYWHYEQCESHHHYLWMYHSSFGCRHHCLCCC